MSDLSGGVTAEVDPAAPIYRDYAATVDDVSDGDRKWVVSSINTGALDSYNTVVSPAGMDRSEFLRNPVVLWEHGRDPTRGRVPIGKAAWIKPGQKNGKPVVRAKTVFVDDDFSHGIFQLNRDGVLRNWSVCGIPLKTGRPTKEEVAAEPDLARCELVYRAWKLKEYSSVAIGGNLDALTEACSRGLWVPDFVRAMAEGSGAGGGALTEVEAGPFERTVVEHGGRWYVRLESSGKMVPKEGYATKAEAVAYLANLEAHKDKGDAQARGTEVAVAGPPALPPLPPLVGRTFEEVRDAVDRRVAALAPAMLREALRDARDLARGKV